MPGRVDQMKLLVHPNCAFSNKSASISSRNMEMKLRLSTRTNSTLLVLAVSTGRRFQYVSRTIRLQRSAYTVNGEFSEEQEGLIDDNWRRAYSLQSNPTMDDPPSALPVTTIAPSAPELAPVACLAMNFCRRTRQSDTALCLNVEHLFPYQALHDAIASRASSPSPNPSSSYSHSNACKSEYSRKLPQWSTSARMMRPDEGRLGARSSKVMR